MMRSMWTADSDLDYTPEEHREPEFGPAGRFVCVEDWTHSDSGVIRSYKILCPHLGSHDSPFSQQSTLHGRSLYAFALCIRCTAIDIDTLIAQFDAQEALS